MGRVETDKRSFADDRHLIGEPSNCGNQFVGVVGFGDELDFGGDLIQRDVLVA